MLVLQYLRRRFHIRIDHLASCRHLGNFLKHHRIMNCLMRVLAPSERAVIFTKDRRHRKDILNISLKIIHDQDSGDQKQIDPENGVYDKERIGKGKGTGKM